MAGSNVADIYPCIESSTQEDKERYFLSENIIMLPFILPSPCNKKHPACIQDLG